MKRLLTHGSLGIPRLVAPRQRPALAYPNRSPFLQIFRSFHPTLARERTETHILTDIGEGTKEVQIIQWFVEEGATIEEWSPLCEVQSDKASVEITSKFNGVVKKIHFERDAIVQVGDAMVDIEVEGAEDAEGNGKEEQVTNQKDHAPAQQMAEGGMVGTPAPTKPEPASSQEIEQVSEPEESATTSRPTSGSLATPAVRALLKEHKLDVEAVQGSGKDGRVLKEDVYKHLDNQQASAATTSAPTKTTATTKPEIDAKQVESPQKLTPIQSAMFKSMTASLSIPHFLYSDTANVTSLAVTRSRLNALRNPETTPKLSYMPFIIKAVSLALNQYPLLNARVDIKTDASKPQLIMRASHNIGVAMDTPSGLLVPVIKSVNARSITSIAQELQRLSELGRNGKLSNADLSGGTITVSNIGNIGGEVVGPVIVEGQLAILGVGKIKAVPVFAADGRTVERADVVGLSWSADHRVVDGATMARMAQTVQNYLEESATMLLDMS